ncbi:MAG: hypothetical protein HYT80_10920 [Euryarchaeota archaeon]|nr:hypothetical protein [Euryarchaeota archaeon]
MATADELLALIPWRYGEPEPAQRRIADFLEGYLPADEKAERAAIAYVEHWDALAVLTPTRIVIASGRLFRVHVETFTLKEITHIEDGEGSRIEVVLKAPGRRFHFRLFRDPEGEAFRDALTGRLRPKKTITFTSFDARRAH